MNTQMLSINERARLEELHRYSILDTPAEKDFDDLVKLASQICGTPISLISLIDENRQWFKANVGLPINGTPRDISFCTHAIEHDEPLVVSDALADDRFKANPLVLRDPHIRFYAGVPLKSSLGFRLGTLCVIDRTKRELTEQQMAALKTISRQIMNLLDLRLNLKQLKIARNKISENEMRFRSLADNSPIGIFQTDAEGKGIYVNPKWCEISSISESEALRIGWISAVHRDDRQRVIQVWTRAINAQTNFSAEFRFQNPTKGMRWVKSNASPMYTGHGSISGYVGTLEDITERKIADQNLKESERKYRLISANSKDVIALMTSTEVPIFTFLSPSCKEVFGYEPEEIVGRSLFELIHPDDKLKIQHEIHPVTIQGQTQTIQNRVIKKDGTIIYVEYVSGPAFDDHGVQIGLLATIRDITEQKLAEFKLEESERLYRLISSNSKDLLTIFEATEEARCVYVSPSCKEILGYEPEELIGLSPFEMMPPEEASDLKQNALITLLSGTPVRTESQIRKSDGTFIWVEALSQPIFDEHGVMIRFQSSVRDISDRKRLEQQLRAEKAKAEEMTQTKSHFLSTMSHEIRTPMNAIIGLTNLMLEENPREDQVESLGLLKFSGENLLALINDILDFNKIEAGKVELEHISFNLKDIVQKHINLLKSRATKKGIQLNLSLDDHLPPVVAGDPTRLGQILNNLIGNAIKFTEKGAVTLSLRVEQQRGEESRIEFMVQDTGIGIAGDKLDSIFENFSQASSDTTRKYGGTGLGLSIAQRLVHLMGGEIQVKSTPGVGTTFYFTIGLNTSESKLTVAFTAPHAAPVMTREVNVLLVEDNKINQVVAGNFIKKWNMKLAIANNGLEALEMIKTKDYDVVLMDLQMPEMDGYEATRQIRSMEETYFKNVPVIALSASAMLEEKEKAREFGFSEFITKPFQPQELRESILKFVPEKTKDNTTDENPTGEKAGTLSLLKRDLAALNIVHLQELKDSLYHSLEDGKAEAFVNNVAKSKTTLALLNDLEFNGMITSISEQLREKSTVNTELINNFLIKAESLRKELETQMEISTAA